MHYASNSLPRDQKFTAGLVFFQELWRWMSDGCCWGGGGGGMQKSANWHLQPRGFLSSNSDFSDAALKCNEFAARCKHTGRVYNNIRFYEHKLNISRFSTIRSEAVYKNLICRRLRSPGIDSASLCCLAGRCDNPICFTHRPAQLHRLSDLIPWLLKRLQIRALSTKVHVACQICKFDTKLCICWCEEL